MRIVKQSEFVTMPAGTVYSSYIPQAFGDINIKGETYPSYTPEKAPNCWIYQQLCGDAVDGNDCGEVSDLLHESEETGCSVPMDFECTSRHGMYDPDDTLIAVFEMADVRAMIELLTGAVEAVEKSQQAP